MKKFMFLIYLSLSNICLPIIYRGSELERSFLEAAQLGNKEKVEMLIQHPRFQNISYNYLRRALSDAASNGHKEIVEMLIQHPRLEDISYDLGKTLFQAVQRGHKEIVEMIIKHPKFQNISYDDLGRALPEALYHDDGEMLTLKVSRLQDIPDGFWKIILEQEHASRDAREKIIKMLLENSKVSKINVEYLDEALRVATQKHLQGSAHLLKAYSALKPEADLTNLSLLDNEVYNAYISFLDGNPQDLRNLLFPVGRKALMIGQKGTSSYLKSGITDIYALSPQPYKATIALNITERSLFKLFKRDHIKSLLFSLVKTKSEKEVALDILKRNGLISQKVADSIESKPPQAVSLERKASDLDQLEPEKEFYDKDASFSDFTKQLIQAKVVSPAAQLSNTLNIDRHLDMEGVD